MEDGTRGVGVDEVRILEAGMNYRDDLSGMRYYEQGLVLWVVCSYGSAFGAVEEPDWGEVKAWVGLDGGHLVFKCEDCLLQGESPSWLPRVEDDDEPEEPRDLLCKHAMAVALQALDEGASWYEIPKDPARLRPHEKADEFLRSGRMTLLSRLEAEENGLLLQRLLRTQPDLIVKLERLAVEHLDEVDLDEVAHQTRRALGKFPPEELPAFFGEEGEVTAEYEKSDGESVWNDPEDVLLSYSLRPLVDDMVRRYTVGARSGARVVAFGIVKGLYEDREEPVWDHPMVEEYLADEPSASAVAVLETAAEWDPDFPRHRLAEIAPDWADILKR